MSSRPLLARSRVIVMMAALFAAIILGATACSGRTGAAVAPQVSTAVPATSRVESPPQPSASRAPRAKPPADVKGQPLARSSPVRLQIASIGVDTTLMDLGLRADGTLQVPAKGFPAGWFTGGPTPGQLGPAVIAGHVDMNGPGVFYNLHKMQPGELVIITRADGSKPVFRVTRVAEYLKDKFPTKLVYGNLANVGLRLITCGGTFNSNTGHYEDNIVVFADLISSAQ